MRIGALVCMALEGCFGSLIRFSIPLRSMFLFLVFCCFFFVGFEVWPHNRVRFSAVSGVYSLVASPGKQRLK